ncbi:hypothetical protein KAFR_0E00470 [Kazachstania africana CBS 2517]|uniref:Fibronectin type-III domain-containing protein n=1 Tax=Kazachstania africana (strain ATCC 22294 / BCRC 22015 / CBS 2517 / CECT 1963 / NBRC 1671 / NRRL Y-8276) TaxID=1071382 RepID=H2AV01_KAZAF|nr:hypothetical protein KAFR_0E00470 [Kazachstania africana CBS 2517]CCF58201.1 hypothetical protein KAFR_0E00470 [Kazachstania africana CBS 2517]
MTLHSFCISLAILWLLLRLYKFLSIPVSEIVNTLNIKTPPAVKVSIDKISSTSITIHWENEPTINNSDNYISYFLLYMNNSQVAIFPNNPKSLYTCCSITNLTSQTQYQLDFITVNNMGFVNKVPSIYCMTKEKNNVEYTNEESGLKDREWRRNPVTSRVTRTPSNDSPVMESNDSNPNTYTNLTSLKDLENYSIDDLKKILICSQEYLHDVLAKKNVLANDFRDTKLGLELELENLKIQWSHEIEFKRSLKSNIKSLENSKLLSDLKFEKLQEKIENSKTKITKMKNDIDRWNELEQDDLNLDYLKEKYDKMINDKTNSLKEMDDKVKALQEEIIFKDDENKKLNVLKRTSSSTTLDDLNKPSSNDLFNSNQMTSILKKLDECSNEKTGLSNVKGEDHLSKLNENSMLGKLINEQLIIDNNNEYLWKSTKTNLIKRISSLQDKFNEIMVQNNRLKATIYAQPYAVNNNAPVEATPPHFLPNIATSNSSSNLALLNSKRGQTAKPLLSAFNVSSSDNSPQYQDAAASNLNQVNPSLIVSNSSQQGYLSPMSSNTASFLPSNNNPNMLHDDTIGHPWGFSSPQAPIQPQRNEEDQTFEYDDANHLIMGLQDIIYDETEYPESISNYSKVFTTDQLDSYWTDPKRNASGSNNHKKELPEQLRSPLPSSYNNDVFISPSSMQTPMNGTTLSSSISHKPFGVDGFTTSPYYNGTDTNHQINLALPLHDSYATQSTELDPLAVSESTNVNPDETITEGDEMAANHDATIFHSPSFNFMWHNTKSPRKTSSGSDAQRHKRNKSNSSSRSSWSNKLSLRHKSTSKPSMVIDEATNASVSSGDSVKKEGNDAANEEHANSGRKMSKLLSRSTMNSIFKLSSHDSHSPSTQQS